MGFVRSVISFVIIVVAVSFQGCGGDSDDGSNKDLEVIYAHMNAGEPKPALTAEQKKSFETLNAMKDEDFNKIATPFVTARIDKEGGDVLNHPAFKKIAIEQGVKLIRNHAKATLAGGAASTGGTTGASSALGGSATGTTGVVGTLGSDSRIRVHPRP